MDDSWAWTEHQIPPYISSFDQSLPGIYFLYYFIFKLLGASIFSIRLFDYFFQLINLSLIFYLTQKISPPEWRPLDGLIAVLLYSTFYLSLGPTCTVLKDGFVLTPMLISGSLYLSSSSRLKWLNLILIALLSGIALTIKPNFILLGIGFALLYFIREVKAQRPVSEIVLLEIIFGISVLIPILIIISFLWRWKVMNIFWEAFWIYNLTMYLKIEPGGLSGLIINFKELTPSI